MPMRASCVLCMHHAYIPRLCCAQASVAEALGTYELLAREDENGYPIYVKGAALALWQHTGFWRCAARCLPPSRGPHAGRLTPHAVHLRYSRLTPHAGPVD